MESTLNNKGIIVSEISIDVTNFQQIVSHSPHPTAIIEVAIAQQELEDRFKMVFINQAFAKLFNLNLNLVLGRGFYQLLPQAKLFWSEYFNEVILTGKAISATAFSAILDKHIHLIIQPGCNNHIVLHITDLSRQKKLEYKIFQDRNKYKGILNASPIGFAMLVDRCFVHVNPKFCKLTGYRKDELLGQNSIMIYANEDFYSIIGSEYSKLIGGKVVESELKIRQKDGNLIDVLLCMTLLQDNLKPQPVIVTLYDISSRKSAELQLIRNKEKLKESIEKHIETNNNLIKSNIELIKLNAKIKIAQKKAEENNQLKTAFLQNVSHEIRTPLNVIMGFSQLIERNLTGHNINKKYVDIILQHGNQLLEILDEILEISLIETNQVVIKKTMVDINQLLFDILSLLEQKAKEINKSQVKINLLPIPENQKLAHTDQDKLTRIIKQLTNNALKYCHKGHISFGFHSIENNYLTLQVKDTGIGIPEKELDRIFERFIQVEVTNQTRSGLGVGLSIVKGLVSHLGGKVWVQSQPGTGTSFYVSIPVYEN